MKLSISQDRVGEAREKAVFILTYGLVTEVQLAGWKRRLAISVQRVEADRVELMLGANVKKSIQRGDAFTFFPETSAELQALGGSPISFRVEP